MVTEFLPSSGGKEEPVYYYRLKNGWIDRGGSQASLQMHMARKGAVPLPKYGPIQHSEDFWGPILRHPDGPAEFPVDQILAYRWYRKDMLPDLRPIVQQGRTQVRVGTQPVVRFPQLKGVKITEFPCPENCKVITLMGQQVDKAYHSPIDLGNHLRVMHGYDRSEILKYGQEMGIDFSKTPGGRKLVEYGFDEADTTAPVAEDVEEEEEEFIFTSVSADQPATAEVAAEFEESPPRQKVAERVPCPDCGKRVKPMGMTMHRTRYCAKQVATV